MSGELLHWVTMTLLPVVAALALVGAGVARTRGPGEGAGWRLAVGLGAAAVYVVLLGLAFGGEPGAASAPDEGSALEKTEVPAAARQDS